MFGEHRSFHLCFGKKTQLYITSRRKALSITHFAPHWPLANHLSAVDHLSQSPTSFSCMSFHDFNVLAANFSNEACFISRAVETQCNKKKNSVEIRDSLWRKKRQLMSDEKDWHTSQMLQKSEFGGWQVCTCMMAVCRGVMKLPSHPTLGEPHGWGTRTNKLITTLKGPPAVGTISPRCPHSDRNERGLF